MGEVDVNLILMGGEIARWDDYIRDNNRVYDVCVSNLE